LGTIGQAREVVDCLFQIAQAASHLTGTENAVDGGHLIA